MLKHLIAHIFQSLSLTSCEYLVIDINTKLDPKQQWNKFSSQISRNVYLLKQLKKIGLDRKILVSVYNSLVLSKLRYSAVVLDSCTKQPKSEMQHLQNRMTRVIGLDSNSALNQHLIWPVSQFIEQTGIEQVTRILDSPTDALASSLRANHRTNHNRTPYSPIAKTEKFNNSAVMKTVRHIN